MTVQELVNKALQLIGVIAAGHTPAPEESDDAFAVLNNLVSSWNAQQIPLYQVASQTVPLTGAEFYTLTSRPNRIKSADVRSTIGTCQSPALVDALGWAAIPDKTRTGIYAEALFCDYGFPDAKVYLTPRPTGGTLEVWAFTRLSQFTSLSQTITLPDGYERALRTSLAVELAPEYGRTATPELVGIANEAKNAITQLNATVLGEVTPGAAATTGRAA
jgi:hypothetical protein